MRAIINLMLNLPWWADLAIVAALIAFVYGLKIYISRKFDLMVRDAVLEVGAHFRNAHVEVHAVEAKPAPTGRSIYDLEKDDENFMEGVDDEAWDEEGTNFYSIDVTISPVNPDAAWDPTALSLVPADYAPKDETEVCHQLCPLHSAEVYTNGRFLPVREAELRGSQRLRMLFAVHEGLRAVQFGFFVAYFGHIDLPAPIPRDSVSRT